MTYGCRSWPTVAPGNYDDDMSEPKIWTADELEKLSPNERRDVVRAGFESDLSNVSSDLLERARRKIEAHIAATEGTPATDR